MYHAVMTIPDITDHKVHVILLDAKRLGICAHSPIAVEFSLMHPLDGTVLHSGRDACPIMHYVHTYSVRISAYIQ